MAASSSELHLDDIIWADQDFHSPISPASSSKIVPGLALPQPDRGIARQQFSGPSHDYEQFKQQTGLPSGALSGFSGMTSGDTPDFDMDMDMHAEFDLEAPPFFYGGDGMATEDFVDPSVIDSHLQVPAMTRAWPGMHSQQAEQARAQSVAKQRAATRPRTTQVPQQQQQPPQQQLPQDFEQTYGSVAQSQSRSPESATDSETKVDERISQLLGQIRHSTNNSATDADDDYGDDARDGLYRRKADEDMDDDERLLASEEGKKLSSKERRQLRNKVSARAFRSRRKEYITQLEGEVATKATEVAELKQRNRTLLAQNQQLTDLAQTMLHHPAFSTFMDDISRDPGMLDRLKASATASLPKPSSAPAPQHRPTKQEKGKQPALQHQNPLPAQLAADAQSVRVGMSLMPDAPVDLSNLKIEPGVNTPVHSHLQPAHAAINPANMFDLNANMLFGGFQTSQVFAVLELPAGPALSAPSMRDLSGKPSNRDADVCTGKGKDTFPDFGLDNVEYDDDVPSLFAPVSARAMLPACDLDETDPAYELYKSEPRRALERVSHAGAALSGKTSQYELAVTDAGEGTLEDVDALFAAMSNGPMRRIERLIAGLSS